jgi:hypothetical protein
MADRHDAFGSGIFDGFNFFGGYRNSYATGAAAAAVTGVSASTATGTVVASGAAQVTVTGVAAQSTLGLVSATGAGQVAVTGVAAQSAVGAVIATGAAHVAVTGVSASTAIGQVLAAGAVVAPPARSPASLGGGFGGPWYVRPVRPVSIPGTAYVTGVSAQTAIGIVVAHGDDRFAQARREDEYLLGLGLDPAEEAIWA